VASILRKEKGGGIGVGEQSFGLAKSHEKNVGKNPLSPRKKIEKSYS
jgi:hypothetical protein